MLIIKRPIITEKTIALYKKNKKVVFEIDINTTKTNAKKALEQIYSVKVDNSRIINRLGKYKMSRKSRKLSKVQDKKIGIFKLKEGSKIDLFEKGE
jgi:large subunit ribosomal protein L23